MQREGHKTQAEKGGVSKREARAQTALHQRTFCNISTKRW